MKLYGNSSRGWGVLEKIPFVGMDGYFLQLHIAKKVNIVTCDVQFFDLTVPREWSCHTSGKISTAGGDASPTIQKKAKKQDNRNKQ